MSDGFDQLAKAMAADGLTRRQALKRVGIGAGAGLLALIGGSRISLAAACKHRGQSCMKDSDCCAGLKCRSTYGSSSLVSSCG
jgi:hypothetical protein